MTSPAGVGTSPSILAQALPSDLSPLDLGSPYSWEQDDAYDPNEDLLQRYVDQVGPGTPVAGIGTPPSTSTPRATVAGVGTFTTRNIPGRRTTPPGREYLASIGKRPRQVPPPPPSTPRSRRSSASSRRSSARSRRSSASSVGSSGRDAGPSGQMNNAAMQRQLEQLLQDQRQTAAGRRIAGITTTNTITTTYKNGQRPTVTRNSTSVRN